MELDRSFYSQATDRDAVVSHACLVGATKKLRCASIRAAESLIHSSVDLLDRPYLAPINCFFFSAMISSWMFDGTRRYLANSMVNVPWPWVMLRRSVE